MTFDSCRSVAPSLHTKSDGRPGSLSSLHAKKRRAKRERFGLFFGRHTVKENIINSCARSNPPFLHANQLKDLPSEEC